jgi:hypothetical protein
MGTVSSQPIPAPPQDASSTSRGLVKVSPRAFSSVNLYVDATSGNDLNDGLSSGAALQTLEEAHRRAPIVSLGPDFEVNINLAGVGGFGSSATAQQTYSAKSLLHPDGGHAEQQRFHYRGPSMVLVPDLASGPNSGTISALTNLWWAPTGSVRARTVNATSPGAGYVHSGTRISRSGGVNWTANDPKMRFLRVTRGGRKVIFECPISRNGTNYIDLDIHNLPDGTKLSAALQVGDTIEIVKCGVKVFNPSGTRIAIEGHGGCSGPGDYLGTAASRGGGGFWGERIEWGSTFMAWGTWGLSFDRCDFGTGIGDENYFGGSGVWVNCLHTSLGFILHGGWSSIHDTANCRPDVAANDGTADPIYQDVDAFSMFGVFRGGCRVFVGSGTSNSPAYLTVERNLSVYDAAAVAGLFVGYKSYCVMLDQRSRSTQIQGTDNTTYGVDVQGGSTFQYTVGSASPMVHLLSNAFDDARLGSGATHTWDEVYGGGTLPAPSSANNWLDVIFNFSRITAYSG